MKKILLSITGFLFSLQGIAQQADPYASVTARILSTYNSKDYHAFYGLLSANFKSQQSEADISNFLQQLHRSYGSMKAINYLDDKPPFSRYKVTCRNGELELQLACDAGHYIDGLSFQPYKAPVALKELKSDNPKQSRLDLAVDSLARAYLSEPGNVSLSIGLYKDGKEHYYHYGETRRGSGTLPGNESIYEIGSITKTFTGILLATAIGEGKVKAGDDVRLYLPSGCKDFAYRQTPITLGQLANHTSGLPRLPGNLTRQKNFDAQDPYRNYTKELLFADLADQKLKVAPGTVSDYSNSGVALLGIVLSGVYNKPYDVLVNEKITAPLNMNSTWKEVPEARRTDFCTGYDEKGKETSYWHFTDLTPCGGLRSTPGDMMRYLRANLDTTDSAISRSHATTFQSSKYNAVGMAWQKQQSLSGDELTWHNGGTYGFSSFLGFYQARQCGLFVLSNSGQNVDALSIQLLKELKR